MSFTWVVSGQPGQRSVVETTHAHAQTDQVGGSAVLIRACLATCLCLRDVFCSIVVAGLAMKEIA